MAHMEADGKMYVTVVWDQILDHATAHAMAKIAYNAVVDTLTNDPDFRILVKEGVREAMAKLNVQEVVELAVKQVLGEQKKNDR